MQYVLNNQQKGDETEVIIGRDALSGLNNLTGGYSGVVVVADANAAKHYLPQIKESLGESVESIILPDGEINKNLEFVENILRQLRESGFDRKSLVVGLGGGVMNDIVGFVASMYMRGIDWVMIPTSLIAQADASIGGKTGVNLGGYKNMIGSFWPAKAVLINPGLLDTLPVRDLRNGLAEIMKMGFIRDETILDHVKKISPDTILGEELDKASELAAKAKVEIVNNDMYEAGERKLLNFGHTVGHALEAIALEMDEPLLHGEAIAIGMVAETKLAELEKVCADGLAGEIKASLEGFGLPTSFRHAVFGEVLEHIASDKKNVGDKVLWTLPKKTGQGIYNHVAKQDNIDTAIRSILG